MNSGASTRFKKGQTPWMKGKHHSLEAIEKQKQSHKKSAPKGDAHYNWKGGISSLVAKIRTCFEYRQWRSDVFTRDDFYLCIVWDKKWKWKSSLFRSRPLS